MYYYIGSMQCDPNYLEHSGVPGMKWGVRRYQNPDGTLTEEGRRRYGNWQDTRGKDIYQKQQIRRMNRAQKKIAKQNKELNSIRGLHDKEVLDFDGYAYTAGHARRDANEKIAKQTKKYNEAKSRLEAYENSSEEEKKRARDTVKNKRLAIAAGAATVGAGAALAILANKALNLNLSGQAHNALRAMTATGKKYAERVALDGSYRKKITSNVLAGLTGLGIAGSGAALIKDARGMEWNPRDDQSSDHHESGTTSHRSHEDKGYRPQGTQWGVRRYQNPDGTLTEEGKRMYMELYKNRRK